MAAADYRLLTEATGQRIAAALESLAGTTPEDISADFTKVNADTLQAVRVGKVVNVYAVINSASGRNIVLCTCGSHSPKINSIGGVYDYSTGGQIADASVWAQPPSASNIVVFASQSLSGKIAASVTYIEQ
jgi:hypothetical protein